MKKRMSCLYFAVLCLLPQTVFAEPVWQRHEIGPQRNPIYLCVQDMDGDGDLDVVTTSNMHPFQYRSEVAWFRNNGPTAAWDKFIISSRGFFQNHINNANGVAVADIDGDGRQDVIVGTGRVTKAQGSVYWFKAPADVNGVWQRFTIEQKVANSYFKMYTMDINGDGKQDIIAGGQNEGTMVFTNPGNPTADGVVWQRTPLPADANKTGSSNYLVDLDGDGSIDILNTFMEYTPNIPGNVSWFSIQSDANPPVFTRTMVDIDLPSAFDINSMDVNGDGRKDLIVSTYNNPALYWYEAPSSLEGQWAKKLIAPFDGTDIYVGDIDGDGKDDFVISGLLQKKLSWFSYDRPAAVWTEHIVDTIKLPGDVSLNDMDVDGDLDIVLAGMGIHKIVWYENPLQ